MPTPSQPAKQPYMCLREAFRTTFPWNHQRLTRDGFRQWARTRRTPPINVNVHHWRPMRDGQSVPYSMVEAFSEYIALQQILPANECRVSVIAAPCEKTILPRSTKEGRQFVGWDWGWKRWLKELLEPEGLDDEAYCRHEADLRLAASMTMESLAAHDGQSLPKTKAIAYGEHILERSLDEYTEQLLCWWKVNEACVMFPTLRRGRAVQRVGVNVMVPLSEEYRRHLYVGEVNIAKIGNTDIAPRSRFVLCNTVAENRAMDTRHNKLARARAHWCINFYQFAELFLPLEHADWEPEILSVAGTKEGHRRLLAFGFKPIGVRSVLTGKEVMTLVRPDPGEAGSAIRLGEYKAMRFMIEMYQGYIAERRLLLD